MSQGDQKETILSGFAKAAEQAEEAIQINDYIYVSKDISDSILITTPEGNIVVNAGLPGRGVAHKARYAAVSEQPLKYLILTQCHADHFGGAQEMKEPGTQFVTHEDYTECREYWILLEDFYAKRSNKLWGSVLKDKAHLKHQFREVTPDITFADHHSLELGGRELELLHVPGGESLDSVAVWLPGDRVVITGNFFGPIFGHLPNLYTIRGDKIRSAVRYVESLERLLALKPELLITGHEVIRGEKRIAQQMAKMRDAVLYLHQKTIEGMNAGKTIHTLMGEIQLPPDLKVGQGHGKTSWCVRAIWEEYAGWFHYDSTTSLYHVPRKSIAGDLIELSGGIPRIVHRAEKYSSQGKPLEALHLLDIVLAVEPDNKRALKTYLNAHQLLLAQSDGENFSEKMWLLSEIAAIKKALEL